MGGIDWSSRIGYGVDPVRRGRTDVIGSAGRFLLLLAQESADPMASQLSYSARHQTGTSTL